MREARPNSAARGQPHGMPTGPELLARTDPPAAADLYGWWEEKTAAGGPAQSAN